MKPCQNLAAKPVHRPGYSSRTNDKGSGSNSTHVTRNDWSEILLATALLRHDYEELNNYNELLNTQHFQFHARRRRRRRIVNGVGYLANELFGVLDSRFAEQYTQDIEIIKSNEKHLAKLWKNQTPVFEIEFNVLKNLQTTVDKQHKFINKKLNEFEESTNALQRDIHNVSHVQDLLLTSLKASYPCRACWRACSVERRWCAWAGRARRCVGACGSPTPPCPPRAAPAAPRRSPPARARPTAPAAARAAAAGARGRRTRRGPCPTRAPPAGTSGQWGGAGRGGRRLSGTHQGAAQVAGHARVVLGQQVRRAAPQQVAARARQHGPRLFQL
ncbi:unnamed protein product [Leptidea sinapis]|uniref:Uncharacterized protein n=1 Tax=Leptidea sinapis TaxID=189913 RepID=A0A5E4R6F6_9NEOP|nr:unnamed protein product [Leptidea sinapis]